MCFYSLWTVYELLYFYLYEIIIAGLQSVDNLPVLTSSRGIFMYGISGFYLKLRLESSPIMLFSRLFWNRKFWGAEGLDRIYPLRLRHLISLPNVIIPLQTLLCQCVMLGINWQQEHIIFGGTMSGPDELIFRSISVPETWWACLLRSKPVNHQQQLGVDFKTH